MGSKLGSVTPTKAPTQSTESAAFKLKVDRTAYLLQREQQDKPYRKELAALKAEMQVYGESQSADAPIRLHGTDRPEGTPYLDLTMREMRREVTDKPRAFAALRKVLNLAALAEALNYTFKLLDQYVPAAEQDKFVAQDRTGSRDITGGVLVNPSA